MVDGLFHKTAETAHLTDIAFIKNKDLFVSAVICVKCYMDLSFLNAVPCELFKNSFNFPCFVKSCICLKDNVVICLELFWQLYTGNLQDHTLVQIHDNRKVKEQLDVKLLHYNFKKVWSIDYKKFITLRKFGP